jgi:Holliday junction resolvasome RuvABC endonuclease subunit
MGNKPITILGINPGTRYLGIAVFHGAELRDWRVKVMKGKWSKEKLVKISSMIADFIERLQPDVLAIKKLHPSRSSKNIDKLIEELKMFADTKKIPVYEYPIKFIEAFLWPARKVNKRQLAELMADKFSMLFSEWEKEKNGKNSYYMRMFEAVFVAYACFRQLDRHREWQAHPAI